MEEKVQENMKETWLCNSNQRDRFDLRWSDGILQHLLKPPSPRSCSCLMCPVRLTAF